MPFDPAQLPAAVLARVRAMVEHLSAGRYDLLIGEGRVAEASAEELRAVVASGPFALVCPPDHWPQAADLYRSDDGSGWGLDVDLWQADGPCDLTAIITIEGNAEDALVRLDDLRVM